MMDTNGRIVKNWLIGSKRSIIVVIRSRRVPVSFDSTALFMLVSARDFRASKYQMVGKKNPERYKSGL